MNFLLLTFLAVFLFRCFTQFLLEHLNLSYLRHKGTTVPEIFQDIIDQESLRKISSYTFDSNRFNILSSLASEIFFLIVLLSGFLPWLVKIIHLLGYGLIGEGLIFFGLLSIMTNLFHIPFNLYGTFVIEDRYGFNTMTHRMWIADLLKSMVIVWVLGGLCLWFLFTLIIHGGNAWWLWAWMLAGGFELLMLWIFPAVIAPLFNKFEPMENETLERHLRTVMEKVGLQIKGILKMDASKRSRHTNAYFTGIGRTKRIVLFDTLMASHNQEEIVAVLSHEMGHWKKRHLLKQILLVEVSSLIMFYAAGRLLNWQLLYSTFGFEEPVAYVGLFLIGALLTPLSYFLQPLKSMISRRFEKEADDFVSELLKTNEPMCNALKRLAADNLENLVPHPLYAWFYYSHPPLVERIERLKRSVPPSTISS